MKAFSSKRHRNRHNRWIILPVIALLLIGCAPLQPTSTMPQTATRPPSSTSTLETSTTTPEPPLPSEPPSPAPLKETVNTPAQQITLSDQPPRLSNDLLLLANGQLSQWDHQEGMLIPLVSQVVSYTLSADGTTVALLRNNGMTGNASELNDLELLDLTSKKINILVNPIAHLHKMAVSPDGRWIGLIFDDKDGSIQLLSTQGGELVPIASCRQVQGEGCSRLLWSPDSQVLLWSDSQGIWVRGITDSVPILAMPADVKINDPKGNAAQVTLTYSPYRWSPQGRFLLTQVQPQDSSIHWVGVIDTRTNRLGMIPGSYGASIECIAWTWDGSLLVPRAPESNPPQPAQVDLWDVLPTRDDLVLFNRSYPLPGEALSGIGAAPGPVQDVMPCWFKQASDQVVRSAIIQQQTGKILALSDWHLRYGSLPGSQLVNLAAADPLWAPLRV